MELTDLRETAEMAYLYLSEKELQEAFPAFNQMLAFFAVMQEAENAFPDKAGNVPATVVNSGHFRPDAANTSADLSECMLSQAAERDGRFIVIPNVL